MQSFNTLTSRRGNPKILIQKVFSKKRIKIPQVHRENECMQDSEDNNNTIPECLKIFMV